MEETVKEKAQSFERIFREQIHSFSDFGKLDRKLYLGHRKRLLTNSESVRLTEKPNFERVRNFTRTKRGIKNHGDFLRLSSSSSLSNMDAEGQERRTSVLSSMSFTSENCFEEKESGDERYKVVLFGIPGVGKSFFLQQIRTSEFLGSCPEGPDPGCITVPVVLGGKESIIDFVEAEMYIQNHGHISHYDAFVMMFSVADKRSFGYIANRIENLREEIGDSKPIYIIANKTDIIRFREVSTKDGLELAQKNNCHYMEVSVSLQWNVDKALVDITDGLQTVNKSTTAKSLPKPTIEYGTQKQPKEQVFKKRSFSMISRLRKFFGKKALKIVS